MIKMSIRERKKEIGKFASRRAGKCVEEKCERRIRGREME